jgi:hypothetical protein
MKNLKIFIAVISVCSVSVFAQAKIENREIMVYGEREIVLPQVDRNYEKINFDVPRENYPAQKYNYTKGDLPKMADFNAKAKILPIKEPVLDKLYPYYVKAGFGNYFTPMLELSAANKRNEKYMYVAHYKHLSSVRGPVLKSFSGQSNNELELTTKFFNKNFTILADVDYTRRMYKYYGFNTATENRAKDTIRQVYNEPTIRLGANYHSKDSSFVTQLVGYYEGLLSKKYSKENDLGYNYSGEYNLKKRNLPGKLFWTSDLAVISKTDITKLSRYLFTLSPTYQYDIKGFKLDAGFGIASENDSSKYSKGLHVYPILKASTVPLKGLGVFAEISGNMQKNTLKTTTNQMPFLERNANVFHTNNKLGILAGVNFNVVKSLFVTLNGKYQRLTNLPFYVNGNQDSSRFVVTYDSTGKTNLAQLNIGSSYELRNYNASLNLELNSYKLGDGRVAMHRPTGVFKNSHSFNYRKKIYLDLTLWYLWGIKSYNTITSSKVVALNNIFDVSLGVKYKLNERAGVFVDVNNILSKKYERYLHYKSQGINVMVGAFASF